ncbi:MAG: hypothetical protein EAZ43_10230 [Betaproteobacteria bacterium]|nr:MAG: hypothetical protein EAZ43_10230 [Betaproteobacteria bacterium]
MVREFGRVKGKRLAARSPTALDPPKFAKPMESRNKSVGLLVALRTGKCENDFNPLFNKD